MSSFLIDIATIKKLGFVNKNVDDPIISVTLRRVQDTVIKPILSTTFYNRLIEGVYNDDLNADEINLLNTYITPCIVAAVDYRIINALTYETRSKTVGTARDEHINPVTIEEKHIREEDLKRDFEVYRKELIGYLCDNSELFPEYENYSTDDGGIAPDKGRTRTRVRFR
ncbi:MAG: hypothetical protein ACK5P0_01990 [bacterium]|jgi:hypothetical protein